MPKIIIAEDEETLRTVGGLILEKAIPGVQIIKLDCGNALEQLLQLATERKKYIADLIFTDNSMPPGLTGSELIEKYALRPGCPPIILHYGGDPEIGRRALKNGAVYSLSKPANIRDIREVALGVLERL